MVKSVTVRAPCSTANLGPGFDVFGLALDAFYDEVTVTKKGKGITIVSSDDIPLKPEQNTAGLVAKAIRTKKRLRGGIEIKIKKKIPPGYGMGSSAASAAACVIGINKLYNLKLSPNELVSYAGIGEKASAGSIHYDNVAASVLGGFVIVSSNPLSVIRIEAPKDLALCVAVPKIKVPKKKTKVSRGVIPKMVKLSDSIINLSNAANIVTGFLSKDSVLIGQSVIDVIVEPARKHMIPGYDNVKKNALKAGAFGVTISGAGPSVIAFASEKQHIKKIGESMKRGFKTAKVDCDIVICKSTKGPKIVKVVK
jgi:homoserine kinase